MSKFEIDQCALFEHVYTNAPVGIALISVEGKWMKANPALCDLLGYTEEELERLNYRDLAHPDDRQEDDDRRSQLLDGTIPLYHIDKRYIRKDGKLVWASLHVSIVRSAEGNPLYFICHIADISAKKAAEEKLLRIEELYRIISDNALDIISYSTPDGVTQYVSPSVRNLLGYTREEFEGRNNADLYHPDDVKRLLETPFSDSDVFTYRVRHKMGHYVWFETTTKIIRDEQGAIQLIVGIGRDVTERKKIQDNLAEAQRIASLGSWEWDLITDKREYSDEIFHIFQLDKTRLAANEDLLYLIHPDEQEQFKEYMDGAREGRGFSAEFRHMQPDGSVKYLTISVSVVANEQGTPVKIYGVTQDITQHKLVEMKLQETVERYTSLKKYNHDAVVSLDMQGRIIHTNSMAEELTGYSVKEMSGQNISRFIGENLNRLLSESPGDPSAERSIHEIRHRDGHRIEVIITVAPIIINSENVGFYIIAKDITEQKNLLIAKEAAEKTNKAKSEFLAMMSHEIRTPMNGVIGMTDLLLETTDLDETQKDYVQIIQKSGNMLLSIINDILDFSRIESGKVTLEEHPFNLKDCISETVGILLPKVHEKKLEMTVTLSPELPSIVVGDANRLKQILTNLVGNAIKFTFSGGIAVTVMILTRQRGSVQIEFRVKDTGIGIPAEKYEHLFEPFQQLDHFMNRKTEGTGLGLAISKRLVEMLGGKIWIEPADGPGAAFGFTVTFREEHQPDSGNGEASPSNDGPGRKSLHVLVAEDNEINRRVLTKMLERMGHRISIAENGSEAIQASAYDTFDAIFMDIQMPVMNGIEATRVLKESFPAEKCPYIIAVTANALNGDREKYLAAGMDDYISKPISSQAVAEALDRLCQRR